MPATIYRCWWCECTTRNSALMTIGANGMLKCRDCRDFDAERGMV